MWAIASTPFFVLSRRVIERREHAQLLHSREVHQSAQARYTRSPLQRARSRRAAPAFPIVRLQTLGAEYISSHRLCGLRGNNIFLNFRRLPEVKGKRTLFRGPSAAKSVAACKDANGNWNGHSKDRPAPVSFEEGSSQSPETDSRKPPACCWDTERAHRGPFGIRCYGLGSTRVDSSRPGLALLSSFSLETQSMRTEDEVPRVLVPNSSFILLRRSAGHTTPFARSRGFTKGSESIVPGQAA